MKIIRHAIFISILISLVLFIFSCLKKNDLPDKNLIMKELDQVPLQEPLNSSDKPFQIKKGGNIYTITPLYKYELYGLSVADYDSENWLDVMHKKDPLNTKDICAVWGNNAIGGIYQNSKFGHGEFTCFVKSTNVEDDMAFKNNEFSNNHLIPASEEVYKKIKEAQVGDQIYLKGYLANYEFIDNKGDRYSRNSSITRSDNGNGACEVVYVTDFKILAKADSFWRSTFQNAKFFIPTLAIIYLIIFFFGSSPKEEVIKEDFESLREREKNIQRKTLPPGIGDIKE
jgi:hypothetical protein